MLPHHTFAHLLIATAYPGSLDSADHFPQLLRFSSLDTPHLNTREACASLLDLDSLI